MRKYFLPGLMMVLSVLLILSGCLQSIPNQTGGSESTTQLDDFYFIAEDPNLVNIVIDWNNDVHEGNAMPDTWGSGAKYDTNATYEDKNCWEITPGNNWGIQAAVLAFMGDIYKDEQGQTKVDPIPVDISQYSYINLVIAAPALTGSHENFDIKMKIANLDTDPNNDIEISILGYFEITADWQTVKIPLSDFGTPEQIKDLPADQIAIFTLNAPEPFFIADWWLSAE